MKSQRGQAMVLAVLCIGVIMAGIVMYGSSRSRDSAATATKVDDSQTGYEALAEAAKRVQSMYANEAGCIPETLDTRLSALPNLPTAATDLGIGTKGMSTGNVSTIAYAIAEPTNALGTPTLAVSERQNRCGGGAGTGCRQIGVPIDTYIYIVTVGNVAKDGTNPQGGDCPRDASVFLSVAINGNLFTQRVTLTNLCTFAACNGASAGAAKGSPPGRGFDDSFSPSGSQPNVTYSPITVTSPTGLSAAACTGTYANILSRNYGAGFTEVSGTSLSYDDLRWARRYLETGGERNGETNFLYANPAVTTGNGACDPAFSASQCKYKFCFPMFDLNRDGRNNEEDMTILENFLRGYLTTLPVNELP